MKLLNFGTATNINDPNVWAASGGGSTWITKAGIRVDPDNALTVGAVYAAVRVISETMGMLPLHMFRRVDGGKERAETHYLNELFTVAPNKWQTPMEWVEMMTGHAAMRGNGYSRIVSGPRGFVDQLIPLNPNRVTPRLLDSGELVYDVREKGGEKTTLDNSEIFHLRGFGDGVSGLPVVGLMRETIGLAMASEVYGNRFFKNAAAPSGVLEHPGELSDEAQDRLQGSFSDTYSGSDNAFKVVVLEEGMKWHQVGMSHEDAQFLETRRFTVTEIARWFRLPPHMIGDLERATFTNIEQQSLEFVTYSMLPWIKRFEKAILRDLIIRQKTFFAEFTVDAILRGDTKSRFESYQIALQNGILTRNEVRRLENKNDIEGGEDFVMPLNMAPVDPNPNPEPTEETEAASGSFADEVVSRYQDLLSVTASRLVRKEISQVKRGAVRLANDNDAWRAWVAGFYQKHAAVISDSMAIPRETAKLYCDLNMIELLEDGASVLESWSETKPDALAALAS